MPVIATEAFRFSNVVKEELWPSMGYCRKVVVVNDAAATFAPGTVLGKVTATGKYKVSKADAVDGSEVPDAIALFDQTIPATTDTNVVVMDKGPAIVSKFGLLLDATFNTGPELAAAYAALEAKGINVNDAV